MKTEEKSWDEQRMQSVRKKYEYIHNLWCPLCGEKQSIETLYLHVSYWGDEEREQICENCGTKFMVTEIVNRTFRTKRM